MMTKWRMVVCFSMFAVELISPKIKKKNKDGLDDSEEDTAGEYLFLIVTE